MEAPLEHVLEHPKSPAFMDPATNFTYDNMMGLDYLQYPQSPYGLSSQSSSSPRLSYSSLNFGNGVHDYAMPYSVASARPLTPIDSTSIFTAALSAGEMSSDSMATSGRRGSRSSGTHSPPPQRDLSAVPRSQRFNPLASVPARVSTRRNKRTKSEDFDDEDDSDFNPALIPSKDAEVRREEIRRQRIESEQRRRDELREGYRRLKDALPVSNQKSSKVCLLDRATTHIKYLEVTNQQLTARVQQAEAEMQRLRSINERMMLNHAERAAAAASQQNSF